jgi:CHAT domain-containing protein
MRVPTTLLLILIWTTTLYANTQPAATPLETGKLIERNLAASETHAYEVTLAAGTYALVDVDQRGLNVSITVFADGQKLRVVDLSGTGDPEQISLVADRAMSFRLEVMAVDRAAVRASYALSLKETRSATEQDKARVEGEKLMETAMQLLFKQTGESRREAAEKFQQAVSFFKTASDKSQEARAIYRVAHTYNLIEQHQKAFEVANEGLPTARAAGDKKTEAYLLDAIGTSYNERGERKKALEVFNQALALRPAGDRIGRATTLNSIGTTHGWMGDRVKALEYFNEVAAIFHELGDRAKEASVLSNICVMHNDLSEFKKALEFCNQSLTLKRDVGDRSGEATTLNNIGTVYSGWGEYQKALESYLQAREIHKSLGERSGEGVTLNNIGWVYGTLGEREKAIDFYNQALPPFREIQYKYGIATTLSNMGVQYAELKDFRKALEVHLQVLPLRSDDREGMAITLNNIASCHANLGDKQKALDYYNQAVALHRAVGNPRQLANALRNIGGFHRDQGETAKALEYLKEAREISRAIGDRNGEASTLSHLAKLERNRGNLVEAHKLIEEAISAIESLRINLKNQQLRTSFLASVRKHYEFDVDVLMRLHKERPAEGFAAAALQANERGRARTLLELLREARAEIRQGVDPSLIERERELRRTIADRAERQTRLLSRNATDQQAAALAREIDGLTTDYEQLQAKIRETSPRYAALTQPAPLNLAEIQQRVIDDETLLLEYALGEEKSFLWAVTPDSIKSFELPARAAIDEAARRFYQLLTERGRVVRTETLAQRKQRIDQADAEYPQAAAKLSQMLLAPVASELGRKRLVIVGEGVLQYVPFAALPSPGGNNSSLLIAEHEIVSLPSASVLAVLRQETANRKPASRTVAVLADPVFSANDSRLVAANKPQSAHVDSSSFPDTQRSASESGVGDLMRLRFSRQEADDITRLAGQKLNLKALDFAANRSVVTNAQLSDYRIVHFATHGLINNQHPDLSGIVLSLVDEQARPQNGFLRLYDIYNLKLDADLVVLSACQTALGKEIKGEGLIGLTRGFMYAGAPRVVASFWRIDDRATADIMKRFYAAMLKDGLRPAAALRAAQVSMSQDKRWQAPHYWAAFTIQGEWK